MHLFIFLAVVNLHCCTWAFLSCSEQGLLFVTAIRLPMAVASLVVEHELWGALTSVAAACESILLQELSRCPLHCKGDS